MVKWLCGVLVISIMALCCVKYIDISVKTAVNECHFQFEDEKIDMHARAVDFDLFDRELVLDNLTLSGKDWKLHTQAKARLTMQSLLRLLGLSSSDELEFESFSCAGTSLIKEGRPNLSAQRITGKKLKILLREKIQLKDLYDTVLFEQLHFEIVRTMKNAKILASVKEVHVVACNDSLQVSMHHFDINAPFFKLSVAHENHETTKKSFRAALSMFEELLKTGEISDLARLRDIHFSTKISDVKAEFMGYDFFMDSASYVSKYEGDKVNVSCGVSHLKTGNLFKDARIVFPDHLDISIDNKVTISDLKTGRMTQSLDITDPKLGTLTVTVDSTGITDADFLISGLDLQFEDNGATAYLAANLPNHKIPIPPMLNKYKQKLAQFIEYPGLLSVRYAGKPFSLQESFNAAYKVNVEQGEKSLQEWLKEIFQ